MDDSDLLSIFWVEVNEYLQNLNSALLQIEMVSPEEDDGYQSAVREMNRVAHSMKGAARAVGITLIETIAHYMEEVFNAAMKGELTLTPEVCDTLYDGLDLIQSTVSGEEHNEQALATVLARLEQIVIGSEARDPQADSQQVTTVNGEDGSPPSPRAGDAGGQQPQPQGSPLTTQMLDTTSTLVMRPAEETVRVTVGKLDRLMAEVTELFVARMHSEEQQRVIADLRRMHARWQREWRSVRTAYIRLVRRLQDEEGTLNSELPILFRFLESNQRNLGEANRRLAQLAQTVAQDNVRLNILAEQLQDDIGGMRLMPFELMVGGLQRMVRDLARDTGKQIHLEVTGAQVEIDKAVLDALKDPLVHVLRNAIDHGIETAAQREKADKPAAGRVELVIEQRGSEIVVYVADDGHGIDADRVRRSIVKNRLLSESEAAALSDDEARTYIFYSGLSTSDEVTSLSGRGLGMDIVRDRVESLRGRVSVQSRVGEGTTVTLNVPVSLTRIRCILLRIGDQRFAIPSAMVVRMDQVPRSAIFTAEGRDMLEVNQRPLPVSSLSAILDIPSAPLSEERVSILALQATDRAVAFEVDELYSEQELVLKPLGPELERARFVSGASLLGTGEVIIVLDANDLVRRATGARLPSRRAIQIESDTRVQRLRVLVVDDSITTRTLEKNILETAGLDVRVAVDGVEAWEMLTHHEFDVIISDVEMPNMNGLELTQRIRDSVQHRHIPVILLTSLSKPEQREAGLRAGANAYLVKSRFDQGELLQMIQSVV
jgi:two-component system, chemotaxis family, sensor kinase CheA